MPTSMNQPGHLRPLEIQIGARDRCGHCKRMTEDYKKLGQLVESDPKLKARVIVAKVRGGMTPPGPSDGSARLAGAAAVRIDSL
jgi:hypothetical protein